MIESFSVFGAIFSFSFLVALTGAMAPGPLLTYTIIQSAQSKQKGYLTGVWVIIGHALIEMGIIILLLLGFAFVLKHTIVVKIIGISGGVLLILFGLSIIRNVIKGRIATDFLSTSPSSTTEKTTQGKGIGSTILGGAVVSMANPYWWIWWATIGFAFMVQFNINLNQWPKLIVFFLGHEAGDLVWYLLVSVLSYLGLRRLNRKAYYSILFVCALFMILFGLYLGLSPLIK
jgi:threonine/homoserine/homoserine lactone efflux protein